MMNDARPGFALIASVLLLQAGCAKSDGGDRRPPPPLPPPPVPKRVETPIDATLRTRATAVLEKALTSSDEYFRANAVEAAQGAGNSAIVLKAMGDPSPVVRFAACMAAGEMRLKPAYASLLKLASDPDTAVKLGARFGLHQLGDKRLSHDFETYAVDTDPSIRANTVLALGLLGEPSALKILQAMRGDEAPTVRLAVMEAGWRLGDSVSRDKLIAGTVSADPGEEIVSVLALAAPKNQSVRGNCRGLLTSDYPEVALAAARAVGMLDSDDGYGVALAGARSKDARQRALAALAFGEIGRSDAQPTLVTLLNDPAEGVRVAAAAAILKLK